MGGILYADSQSRRMDEVEGWYTPVLWYQCEALGDFEQSYEQRKRQNVLQQAKVLTSLDG